MTHSSQAQRPKAVFVGPEKIMHVFAKEKPEWNFVCVANPSEFAANAEQIGEFEALLVLDAFFNPAGETQDLEFLLSFYSPFSMTAVISYHPEWKTDIKSRVEDVSYQSGRDVGELYFIPSKGGVMPAFDSAVSHFVQNPTESSQYAVNKILGRDGIDDENIQQAEEIAAVKAMTESKKDNPYLGQVVTVTSSKGGTGKSTVGITLATYIAKASMESKKKGVEDRPLKVVILDLDIRDGQLGFFTGIMRPSLVDIFDSGVSEESVKRVAQPVKRLGLDVILAPRRARTADEIPTEFFVDLIKQLKEMYDYVFLDTSVRYTDELLEKVAYPIADQIIMVTEMVTPSVFSMARWVQEVTGKKSRQGMGISKKKIGIVVNKTLKDVGMDNSSLQKSAQGLRILTPIPSNQRLVAHATNINSMDSILKHDKIREAYRRLARMVVGRKYELADLDFGGTELDSSDEGGAPRVIGA